MEQTTAIMTCLRRMQAICVRCKAVVGEGSHDCIGEVRHRRVSAFLSCLQRGDKDLARWHYTSLPKREKTVVAAILEHASTSYD